MKSTMVQGQKEDSALYGLCGHCTVCGFDSRRPFTIFFGRGQNAKKDAVPFFAQRVHCYDIIPTNEKSYYMI